MVRLAFAAVALVTILLLACGDDETRADRCDRLDELGERLIGRLLPSRFADDTASGERRNGGFRMRMSPRLSVGDRNRIGVKLSPVGLRAPLLRGAYLKLLQDLDEGSARAVLAFEHPTKDQDIYIEYRSDDRRQGEYVRFSVRFSY